MNRRDITLYTLEPTEASRNTVTLQDTSWAYRKKTQTLVTKNDYLRCSIFNHLHHDRVNKCNKSINNEKI